MKDGEVPIEHDHETYEEGLVAVDVFQATLAELVSGSAKVLEQAAIEPDRPALCGSPLRCRRRTVLHDFQDQLTALLGSSRWPT